jgi:predicted RNase H-like nuclease (RuvC/YqgF family)
MPAEFTDAGAQGVILRGGEPEPILEESGSQRAYHDDRLPGDEGSGHEDEALVQGLMALRDELDRLRRESQHAQSELKAARDSTARIIDLEQSLVCWREECETLRAELHRRDREHEEQSSRAANLIQERDAEIEPSETVMEKVDTLSSARRPAAEETPSAADPRLEALIVQLDESRSANERLRALLKVFGMVRHIDQ